jgi:AraC family ethanolamine operon transcriptional activator
LPVDPDLIREKHLRGSSPPETKPGILPRGLRLTVAHDADEQADNLSAWNQRYDQITPGRFLGVINELWLDEIQFYLEKTSHALRQSCVVWPDSFWFGLPRCEGAKGNIDGNRLHDNAIAIKPGNEEFQLVTPASYDIMGIAVKEEVLERYGAALEIADLPRLLRRQDVLLVDLQQKRDFWNFLDHTLGELANSPLTATHEVALKALGQDLIDGLMNLLVGVRFPVPTAAQQNHRRIVSRAKDYLFSHQREAISVMDLCEKLYVSRRTLQNSFQDILGITPLAYLKFIRLNAVRRELKNPASLYHTVQDVAAAWGFWHMGQFAADYHRLFCEHPSEALHNRSPINSLIKGLSPRGA